MKKLKTLVFLLLASAAWGQTWTNYDTNDGLIVGIISNIILDDQGNAWCVDWMDGDNPGIGNFDGTNWSQFSMMDGASGNRFQGLIQDADGDYWFGSFLDETGLDRFDGNTWTNYTTADGLAANNVSDIILGNGGNIWMACWDGAASGITVFDGTDFNSFLADGNDLPELAIRRLDQTSEDVFWLATTGGVVSFDIISYTLYTTMDGLSADAFETVLVDDQDGVWAGADIGAGGGLNHFDGTDWTIYTEADGLPNNSVRALFQDAEGNLWIGTNGGIARFDGTDFLTYTTSDGLIGDQVRAITQDVDGNIWIGTWDGISVLNPTLGVIDNQQIEWAMAPNPSNGYVQINTQQPLKRVQIFDVLGRLQLDVSSDLDRQLDVTALSAGSYWVVVQDQQGNRAFKQLLVR